MNDPTNPPSISSIAGLEDYDMQEFYKFVRTDFINAASRGDMLGMKNMVAQGNILPDFPNAALVEVAGRVRPKAGDLKMIRFLVEEMGADLQHNNEQLLLAAIDHKQIDIIEYYIDKNPDFYKLLDEIIERNYWAHAVEMKSLVDKRILETGIEKTDSKNIQSSTKKGDASTKEAEHHFKV